MASNTVMYLLADPDAWEAAIQPNTKMIFLETPTNPGLDMIDLEAVGKLAKKHKLIFCVDNCFATPIGQLPVQFGADLVIHSATKWLDGQGRVLGGIVLGSKKLIHDIYLFCRSTGPATVSLQCLGTQPKPGNPGSAHGTACIQCPLPGATTGKTSGHQLAEISIPRKSHPQYAIARKQMKNGGGLFCFELKGGLESGRKFLDNLKMLSRTANLGDTRSIASHPASTTHAKLTEAERLAVNITPGLIRISCGTGT